MKIYSVEELKLNSGLKQLIEKYQIRDSILEREKFILSRFLNEYVYCQKNENLEKCKQIIKGVQQKLIYKNNSFYISSKNCNHWIYENQDFKLFKNILFADYDEISSIKTIDEYIKSVDQNELDKSVIVFLKQFNKSFFSNSKKGFYLYGEPGIGKTYLMKMLANTYAKNDKKVIFVTVNKLIKIMKNNFNISEPMQYSKFFDTCSNVEVLILDDIGAELVSDWSRDELLFGLLNYRLENNLLTHFTSNFSIEQLQKFYLNKKIREKDQIKFDQLKTLRFTERIKGLTNSIEIQGKNKRY
ncbi:ATP-binding protein [Spiroplasma taiwanense]|uniref:Primosomal protein DnaI n=1 Tax=Spiroplasma taiwanense CT-1 TaxID=1276220 RepID=S5MCU0_9MOLU|nr:ATP-binding protein [Spiroplasma taiwanense]AGR41543.1 primosomal protein DnaI [Spiroplasma taiwanense CT-1]